MTRKSEETSNWTRRLDRLALALIAVGIAAIAATLIAVLAAPGAVQALTLLTSVLAIASLGAVTAINAAADALYLAPGWQDARGCRIEKAVATEFSIPIIEAKEEES